jgi:alpha-D-ribose 1-methylphosphonate 5-triphosphate diphosphatase
MDMRFCIRGGTGLVHHAGRPADWDVADIALFGARIEHVGRAQKAGGAEGANFDAGGLLVLPGIVDLHGDAFERQIQPRPDTVFSHDIALADTDRQLVANGITTACHGLAYSWEGGLRGREAALGLLHQVAVQREISYADHRIHLRFENHHVDGLPDVLDWIASGRIDFLAFNEHLPSIAATCNRPEKLAAYTARARCDAGTFKARLKQAQSRSSEVAQTIDVLAAACRKHGVSMASHDDETCFDRERYQERGVTVSEFPRTQDALFAALALDNRVVMGAPNVLLDGSHRGGLAAIDAVRSGMCDILVSDYYYPSLLLAPFKLAHKGACTLAEAWRLVAEHPAASLGLSDRGRIAAGSRADLILVEAGQGGCVRLIATIAAGRLAYCAEPARMVTQRAYSLAA